MSIVVDASATLAWLFSEEDPTNWLENHLQSSSLMVPSLWQLEVVHVLLKKERQRHLSSEQVNAFLDVLDSVSIQVVPPSQRTLQEIASLARPHQLSAYDAAYLALAIHLNASLLTLDQNLKDAANRLSVELVK